MNAIDIYSQNGKHYIFETKQKKNIYIAHVIYVSTWSAYKTIQIYKGSCYLDVYELQIFADSEYVQKECILVRFVYFYPIVKIRIKSVSHWCFQRVFRHGRFIFCRSLQTSKNE